MPLRLDVHFSLFFFTVGDMDVAVEPSGMSLRRVTGKTMTINAA
ncbi:hypothetical protein [Shewanella vaxholmensis]